ncbi:MAG: acetyl-CoA decarbonylase/synthase complex subunit delta, partial [Planctomycetota bacterium]
CTDAKLGIWKGIDEYVYQNSHKAIESFSAYSIMNNPMTSCGCFEVILAYVPECNGIMAVNREFAGDTPAGMTFSTLAGNVGGGQQTPGFMGCGKIFLTSRKFLFAEGGHKRLVWLPKELKELLADDLKKRFDEQGCSDLLDKIADETVATEPGAILDHMKSVNHPALELEDMAELAEAAEEAAAEATENAAAAAPAPEAAPAAAATTVSADSIAAIKEEIASSLREELKGAIQKEIVTDIIGTLSEKFLGTAPAMAATPAATAAVPEASGPSARSRIEAVTAFEVKKDTSDQHVHTVTLGATKDDGGTRGKTVTVGGASCMPFHLWEGEMPNAPIVALEVFDSVSEKYPPVLREIYGDLLKKPAEMAKVCVEKYGADLISVRLEGTHPEKGDRSSEQSVELIKQVLEAVDVPLIVTGHNHFDKVNEVMKAVASACTGENLLFNWVEQDNYRTVAGAALAYGHTIVSQSPIDVNIGKQLNILLGNMNVGPEKIIMDPMTGAMGYGIEYTYSVMERIRQTGLGGDAMLCGPMIVSPGQECAKTKEVKAPEADFPTWGDLKDRAAYWEMATAANLLYAGADISIMYHPEAAMALKRTIKRLMDQGA